MKKFTMQFGVTLGIKLGPRMRVGIHTFRYNLLLAQRQLLSIADLSVTPSRVKR